MSEQEQTKKTSEKYLREGATKRDFSSFEEAVGDIEDRRKQMGTLSQTAIIAREVERQSSLAVKGKVDKRQIVKILTGKTDLSEEAIKKAIVLEEEKGVLSTIEEGIEGGELVSKVILALAITLYEQSELYGTIKTLSGATEKLLPLFEEDKKNATSKERLKARTGQTSGRVAVSGDLVESLCPIVLIEIGKFTKLVLGVDTEPRSKDKQRVREVLDALASKKIYIFSEDKKALIDTTIIGKQRGKRVLSKYRDPKTGEIVEGYTEIYRVVELDAIFTKSILNDFAVIRKDTLKILKGRQSRLTMKLLHFLLVQYSYHKTNILDKSKKELFDIIAVAERYKKHSPEADFQEAVERMQQLHLIRHINKEQPLSDPKRGGYYEDIGADGVTTFCHFVFNPNYEQEASSPKT